MSSNSVLNHTHDQQIGLLRRGGPILLSTRMTCPVQTMALIIRLARYNDTVLKPEQKPDRFSRHMNNRVLTVTIS